MDIQRHIADTGLNSCEHLAVDGGIIKSGNRRDLLAYWLESEISEKGLTRIRQAGTPG
jgi:hypothetical protein